MVITVRAILVAIIVLRHVLPEHLLALLARKRHLRSLRQRVLLRLPMALCAIVPLLAARRADRHLRVQDVFAGQMKE